MITCPQCFKQYDLDPSIRQKLAQKTAWDVEKGLSPSPQKFYCAQCQHSWLMLPSVPPDIASIKGVTPALGLPAQRAFPLTFGGESPLRPQGFFSAFLDWIYAYKIDWLLLALGIALASGILYHERGLLHRAIPNISKLLFPSAAESSPFLVQNIRFEERRLEGASPQIVVVGEIMNRSEKVHPLPLLQIVAHGATVTPVETSSSPQESLPSPATSLSQTAEKASREGATERIVWYHRFNKAVLYPNERLAFRSETLNVQGMPIRGVEAFFPSPPRKGEEIRKAPNPTKRAPHKTVAARASIQEKIS